MTSKFRVRYRDLGTGTADGSRIWDYLGWLDD